MTYNCVTLGDFPNALVELEDYVTSNVAEEKILITKPSVYLTGASYAVYEAVNAEEHGTFDDSPVLAAKSVKNAVRKVALESSFFTV